MCFKADWRTLTTGIQVSTEQQKYQREIGPFKTVGHAVFDAGNNSQRVAFHALLPTPN